MNTSKAVVKIIAVFEAAKGALLVLVGVGALSLLHRDVRLIASALVGRLHLNPTRGFSGSFVEAASHLTDAHLWGFAATGFLYALFRFVEAYGLWRGKTWAEWLAVISGGLFIPFEIYEIIQKRSWVRISALVINLAAVAAIICVLVKNHRAREAGANTHTR